MKMFTWNAKAIYKGCFKKKRFKSWDEANKRAKKYNQRIYLCPICGCYHLTSKLEIQN